MELDQSVQDLLRQDANWIAIEDKMNQVYNQPPQEAACRSILTVYAVHFHHRDALHVWSLSTQYHAEWEVNPFITAVDVNNTGILGCWLMYPFVNVPSYGIVRDGKITKEEKTSVLEIILLKDSNTLLETWLDTESIKNSWENEMLLKCAHQLKADKCVYTL